MSPPLLLLQISDLHLGADEPQALVALHALVRRLRPDVLLCTGDITQRARPQEFARAAELLRHLAAPVRVLLPGNHDLPPMWQPWRRWGTGRARWQAFLQALQAPTSDVAQAGAWVAPEPSGVLDLTVRPAGRPSLSLCLVDTCRHWRQTGGAVSAGQRTGVVRALGASGLDWRLIATHHPLRAGPLARDHDQAHGAAEARTSWAAAGADLVLSGHSHVHAMLELPPGPMRQLSCASATSWRRRAGVPNSVVLLRLGARSSVAHGDPVARGAPRGHWQPWIWHPGDADYVAGPARPL